MAGYLLGCCQYPHWSCHEQTTFLDGLCLAGGKCRHGVERTFITSSDADFHAVRGNTGNTTLHTCAPAIATSADAAVPIAQQLAVPIDAPGTLLLLAMGLCLLASQAQSSAAARDAIGTLSSLE